MEENIQKRVRSEKEKRTLISRVHRLIGQMNGIEHMINDDRYCGDILVQLAAIEQAVKGLAGVVMEDHLNTCVVENIQNGNTAVIAEVVELFRRFG